MSTDVFALVRSLRTSNRTPLLLLKKLDVNISKNQTTTDRIHLRFLKASQTYVQDIIMRKILAVIIVTGYLHRTNSFLTPSATKRETVVRRFPLSASPNTVDTGHHDIHPAKVAAHPSETVSERDQMIPLESTIRKVCCLKIEFS
jgi:hypothetical protein